MHISHDSQARARTQLRIVMAWLLEGHLDTLWVTGVAVQQQPIGYAPLEILIWVVWNFLKAKIPCPRYIGGALSQPRAE
ncbi:hypothetical protein NPS49_09440 [Pseudomonas putida]|uniref:hypothetical protein n=1 Tax=Pseudomonas putida TaxID=303 RepID=UPI002364060F|nr:hypothetical protein [Pseudomonas putida]MDD2068542.1 hypothetical protein [Pseudomonas putida]HDS1738474.1 hypothetical protein [Pseudomonas putida]